MAEYKPVPRSKAQPGDIRSVSRDGGSRTYWTHRSLGIEKKNQVGGGASDALSQLSIALAKGDPLPSGVKADVFDRSTGKRTGSTIDVGGRRISGNVYADQIDSLSGKLRETEAERAAALASAEAAEAEATAVKAKGSLSTTLVGGQGLGGAEKNPYASATFTAPTFDQQRYANNADFFNKMFSPGATAHTTPMYGKGVDGGFVGGGSGGGGGFSWGGGQGQYTPSVQDGVLSATRNLGVPSGASAPQPTSKPQANQAGVPDTGGQSAANAQVPGGSQLMKSLQQLSDALASLDVNALFATSDPVDNAVANVDSALSKAYESALADLPDYEKMKQDAKDLYELKADLITDRQEQLEERYKEDKEAIEADFAQQKDDLQQSQTMQQGKLRGGLASAGAYLGFDNVNHSAMLSLQVTHDREMTVLGQAKISALIEARRAFEDADFALLTEHVNAIEAYDKKITELANTHFTQTLQLTQEARDNVRFMQEQESFERNRSYDNLDTIIEAGTMPTEADIQNYARQLKLSPEDIKGYIRNKQNTIELEKKQQKTENELAILRVLASLDKGQFVTIDGKTYEGLNIPAKSGTSSSKALTYEDVFTDFNNSPIARQFAEMGMTKDSVYQLFTQQTPPEEMYTEIENSIPDLSTDENIAAQQVQTAWENMRNDALGMTTSRDLGRFTGTQQSKIVAEINQQIMEGTNTDYQGKLTVQDISADPNTFDYATLANYLRQAEERGGTESEAEQLIRLLNEG